MQMRQFYLYSYGINYLGLRLFYVVTVIYQKNYVVLLSLLLALRGYINENNLLKCNDSLLK